jgi:4-amino-4-deoxy-L-arabinose transferase-like glycosyltransferase
LTKILERPVLPIIILCLLCGYFFFFRLGDMALTDPDEAFYAQTAKEMLARNEWHTPYIFDRPQFEKPILFYVLVEASYKLFGVNEFAARFPSAVFGLLGVIGVYLLGILFFNKRVGFLAAVILAVNIEYIILSRACVTDMALSTFLIFGFLFFFRAYIKDEWYCYIFSAASFAFAVLTKGPVFALLPGVAIVIYLIWTKGLKALRVAPALAALIVFALIACPWYLLMIKMHGKDFTEAFFGFHNITRFMESEHRIGSQFYYNIPAILAGFFPWSAFLPLAFWHAVKKIRDAKCGAAAAAERTAASPEAIKSNLIFILIWFSVIFVFFTVSSTKLPTYIFPLFMSLALMTAVLWDDFLKKDAARCLLNGMRASCCLLLAVVTAGAIGLLIFIHYDYPVMLKGVFVSGVFLAFGFILSSVAFFNKKYLWAFALMVYAAGIFLYPFSVFVVPVLDTFESSRTIARELMKYMKPGERLAAEGNYLSGLAFYTGKCPVDVDRYHLLVNFLGEDNRNWCVIKEKNHRHVYELNTKPYYMKASYMVYKLGKKAVVTNMLPEDGRYLAKRERTL